MNFTPHGKSQGPLLKEKILDISQGQFKGYPKNSDSWPCVQKEDGD